LAELLPGGPRTGSDNHDALASAAGHPDSGRIRAGLRAPCDTPIEIVEKLNQEINAGLANPQIKARLAGLGATALPGSPADFGGKLIAEETQKWGKVVKFAGIKPQ
jgi:tripartite-type tricarboxylate transporter receptor subunit TctC